jgi:hypothetical protein
MTKEELQNREESSGVYTFMPRWDDPLPKLFG